MKTWVRRLWGAVMAVATLGLVAPVACSSSSSGSSCSGCDICTGTDGNCYGPCGGNYHCTTNPGNQHCGKANGGVYCCDGPPVCSSGSSASCPSGYPIDCGSYCCAAGAYCCVGGCCI
jgi:hypothetical protein